MSVFLGDQQTVLVCKHLTCHTTTCYRAASSFIGVQYDVSDTTHLHHSSPLKLLLRPCGQRNRADNNSACIDHQGQVSIAFPPRAFPSACLCDFSFMAVFPDPLPRPAKLAKKTKTTTTTQTELKTPHSPLNNCHLFFLRILARVAIDTDPLKLSFVCPTVLSFKTFSGEQKMDKDAENHFQLWVKEKSNLPWDCEMSEGQWLSACRRSDQRWCCFKSRKSQTTPTRVVLDAEFVFNCSAFPVKSLVVFIACLNLSKRRICLLFRWMTACLVWLPLPAPSHGRLIQRAGRGIIAVPSLIPMEWNTDTLMSAKEHCLSIWRRDRASRRNHN